MTTIASLVVELSASTVGLTRGLSQADRSVNSFVRDTGASLQGIGSSITGLGGSIASLFGPMSAGLGLAVKSSVEFDAAMTNVGAILGRNREDMAGLSAEILNIGANSRVGPQAAAEAFAEIAGGVTDASTHLSILNAAIATSEAGSADLQGTTAALVSTMNAYGFAADKAGFASDTMTQLVGMGVGTMNEFGAALPQVTGLAASLHVPLEDIGAGMAFITTKGFSAGQAATQMAAMMTAAIKPNEDMAAALSEIGFASGEAAVETLGLVGTYEALQGTQTAASEGMAAIVGTTEALNGVIALTGSGFQGFSDSFIEGIDGATAAAQDIQNESPAAQFAKLQSSVSELGITVGDTLIPALTDVFEKIEPIIDSVITWVGENPALVSQIGQIAIAAGGLGIGLMAVGGAIGAVGTIAGAIGAVVSAVGLPVIALGAAVGLFIAIINDPAIQAGLGAWQGVVDMIPGVMQAIAIKIDQTFNDVAVSIRTVVRDIKIEVAGAVGQLAAAGQALGLGISQETVDNLAQEFATADIARKLETALNASLAAGGPLEFDMGQIDFLTSGDAPAGLLDKFVSNLADPRLIQEALGSAITMGDAQAVDVLAPLALKFADDPKAQMQELLSQAFTADGASGWAFQALVPLATELGIDTADLADQFQADLTAAATEGAYSATLTVGVTLNPSFNNLTAFSQSVSSAAQIASGAGANVPSPIAVPAFHDGGVTATDGLALLKAGERVLNPQETADYGKGGGQVNIYGLQDLDMILAELNRRGYEIPRR